VSELDTITIGMLNDLAATLNDENDVEEREATQIDFDNF
jgi:predicted component of type VI protein secretion system